MDFNPDMYKRYIAFYSPESSAVKLGRDDREASWHMKFYKRKNSALIARNWRRPIWEFYQPKTSGTKSAGPRPSQPDLSNAPNH